MAYNRLLQHFTSSQDLTKIWASSQNYIVNDLVVYTPSNKIYRCLIAHTSSGSFFTDLAAGNWVEVSASAAGLKNYITYGDFENNDANTGWSLARSTLDATTKLPNQAAGSWTAAAGTLSKSIVSSGQLAGSYSLSLASSAATTAGDMLVTSALTLDLEAQASVQTFSFFYRVVSGASNGNFSGTSSNSVGVAIYVVDGTLAGTWIQPAGVFNVVQSSGVGKASGTFQVPSDATQVRLAVYFPNATTGAITFYLDDFVLGPQTVQYGAPVTDWVDFTPTFLNATTLNATGKTDPQGRYRRVGDSIEVQVTFQNGSGGAAAGTGDVALRIPAQLTVDTTKLTATVGGYRADGFGTFSTSTAPGQGVIVLNNHLYLLKESSNDYYKIADLSASARWSVKATVPIQGWSSTVQMSNDVSTRAVEFSVSQSTGATTTISSTPTKIANLNNVLLDTLNGWNVANSRYVIPVPGVYTIKASLFIPTSPSPRVILGIFKNGAQAGPSSTTYAIGTLQCEVKLQCVAGDYIEIYGQLESGTLAVGGFSGTNFSVSLSQGPSAIAATETVAARYESSVGATFTVAGQTINFDTKAFDTHNAVTTGASWVFTAPVSGKYRVSSGVGGIFNTTGGAGVFIEIVKGAATPLTRGYGGSPTGAFYSSCNVSDTVQLLAGETVKITAVRDGGSANATSQTGRMVYVAIERIGN